MSSRLSRRRWVLLMGSAPLLAQTVATTPGQTPLAAITPEQRMEKANAEVRQVSEKLAGIEVPMNIEPAFHFIP